MTHYQQFNNSNDLDVLTLVVVTLCLARQDHLCSRSGMSALNADPFKVMQSNVPFILGFTTACTVFSSAAYTVNLLERLASFCSHIVVIPDPTVPPSERCSESETLGKIALMNYLMGWFRKNSRSNGRFAIAAETIARICNTSWHHTASENVGDAARRWRRHVCDGANCFCKSLSSSDARVAGGRGVSRL